MQTQGGTVYQSYVCIGSLFNVLGGNFPCTVLNACNAGHDFNFFLLLRSLGVHPGCVCPCVVFVCACETVSVHLCALICLPFKLECVCVFTCPELINSCEHAGLRSICRSGHGA